MFSSGIREPYNTIKGVAVQHFLGGNSIRGSEPKGDGGSGWD